WIRSRSVSPGRRCSAPSSGGELAASAGKDTWTGLKRLRELVVQKFAGNLQAETEVAQLAVEPSDAARSAVTQRISDAAAADEAFAAERAELITALRADPAVTVVLARAADQAKQVNIGGDNFGQISM